MDRKIKDFIRARLIGPGAKQFFRQREKLLKTSNPFMKKYRRLMCARILYKTNSMIPEDSSFASIPDFPHGLNGFLVSKGACIGSGCVIFQQVTIGSNTLPGTKNPGAPQIGNNVLIGAGAKIIGGVTIGDNVRIGANCVVAENIPANSTVVLEKPRIITREKQMENIFTSWDDYKSGEAGDKQ